MKEKGDEMYCMKKESEIETMKVTQLSERKSVVTSRPYNASLQILYFSLVICDTLIFFLSAASLIHTLIADRFAIKITTILKVSPLSHTHTFAITLLLPFSLLSFTFSLTFAFSNSPKVLLPLSPLSRVINFYLVGEDALLFQIDRYVLWPFALSLTLFAFSF